MISVFSIFIVSVFISNKFATVKAYLLLCPDDRSGHCVSYKYIRDREQIHISEFTNYISSAINVNTLLICSESPLPRDKSPVSVACWQEGINSLETSIILLQN